MIVAYRPASGPLRVDTAPGRTGPRRRPNPLDQHVDAQEHHREPSERAAEREERRPLEHRREPEVMLQIHDVRHHEREQHGGASTRTARSRGRHCIATTTRQRARRPTAPRSTPRRGRRAPARRCDRGAAQSPGTASRTRAATRPTRRRPTDRAAPRRARRRRTNAQPAIARHTSAASTEIQIAAHTWRCGVHSSTTSNDAWSGARASRWRSRRRVATGRARRVRDRRLPSVALRLPEHEPERRVGTAHVHPHARRAVVHHRDLGADGGVSPSPVTRPSPTASARSPAADASTTRSSCSPVRTPSEVRITCAPGGQRDRRNAFGSRGSHGVDREARRDCRPRFAATADAHRERRAVDRQQIGTAPVRDRRGRAPHPQPGDPELGDRDRRGHGVAGRLARRELRAHAGDRDPDPAAGHRREVQRHGRVAFSPGRSAIGGSVSSRTEPSTCNSIGVGTECRPSATTCRFMCENVIGFGDSNCTH